jgi:hypothetical protein
MTIDGEIAEEVANLPRAEVPGMALAVKQHEPSSPVHIGLLGPVGVVQVVRRACRTRSRRRKAPSILESSDGLDEAARRCHDSRQPDWIAPPRSGANS